MIDILGALVIFLGGIYFLKASYGDYIESNEQINKVIKKKVETGFFNNIEDGLRYYKKVWRIGGIIFIISSIILLISTIYNEG